MILMLKIIEMKVMKYAGVGDDNAGEDVSRPQGILNGGEVSLLSSMNTFYTRACCREVKFSKTLAWVIFWCLFMCRIDIYLS